MKKWLGPADYLAALQCERRVWFFGLGPRTADDPRESSHGARERLEALLLERSQLPGALDALSPRSVEVPADLPLESALERTRQLLADPSVPGVRGAVFERGDWVGRADLVERRGEDGVGLRVIAADVAPRELDLDRAALLAFLIEGAQLALRDVQVWFLDRDYRRTASGLNWSALVRRRDVAGEVRLLAGDVPAALARVAEVLARAGLPEVEPSPHCTRPLRCEFWDSCTKTLPRGSLVHLPRLRPEQFHALRAQGIELIADIPDAELDGAQALTRAAWRSGAAAAAPGLAQQLRELGPATAYLDFETAAPRIPLLADSAPLEPVPMQWSALLCDAASPARGAEFLAEPGVDPREPFAQSLVAAFADWSGPIAVYSDFESRVLRRLEEQLPQRAAELARLREQLVDLLEVVREHVAHPQFLGSYSLKRVAPVLCPKISYGDLERVASGADAARELEAWLGGAPAQDVPRLRAALHAYCRRDVEALRALHGALLELAGV